MTDFGDVIYEYTDEQAILDGVLVPFSRKDRVSQTILGELASLVPAEPPANWPIDLMGWLRADDNEGKAAAMLRGLLLSYRGRVLAHPHHRVVLHALLHPGGVRELLERVPTKDDVHVLQMILAENELGGITAMLPEDD